MVELPKRCWLIRVGHCVVGALRKSEENYSVFGLNTYSITVVALCVNNHDTIRS